MRFKTYDIFFRESIIEINLSSKTLSPFVLNIIEVLEEEIVKMYLAKQSDRLGIQQLGNEIRYNKTLKNLFEIKATNEEIVIKLTENKRSFLKIFIDCVNDYPNKDLYFIILQNEFGKNSKLVDNTFIRIEDFVEQLEILHSNFLKKTNQNISVIELTGFSDYKIEVIDKYSKLFKI